MPTLTRLLSIVSLFIISVVLAMYALATFVEPTPREITIEIKNDKLGE
ncbi:hypothetical protein [Flexibacterium corallicola]|nr:hypothetical protein [Pseudovibrio sp. M1P-2-3]